MRLLRTILAAVVLWAAGGAARGEWPTNAFERGGRAWLGCAYSAAVERAEAVPVRYFRSAPTAPSWINLRIQRPYLAYLKGYVLGMATQYVHPSSLTVDPNAVAAWPVMWTSDDLLSTAGLDESFLETPWRGLNTNSAAGWPALRAVLDLMTITWDPAYSGGGSNMVGEGLADYVGSLEDRWESSIATASVRYAFKDTSVGYPPLSRWYVAVTRFGSVTSVFAGVRRVWGKAGPESHYDDTDKAHAYGVEAMFYARADRRVDWDLQEPLIVRREWDAAGSGMAESNWVHWSTVEGLGYAVTSAWLGASDLSLPDPPSFYDPGTGSYIVTKGWAVTNALVLMNWTALTNGFRYRAATAP